MAELAHSYIGGEWVPGAGERERRNPARADDVVLRHTTAGEHDVRAAVDAASAAAADWRTRSPIERAAVLRQAAATIAADERELAELLTREEGKVLADSLAEVRRAVDILHFHAAQAWQATGEAFASGRRHEEIRTVRVPVGVVAAITPFNFPLAIPAWKLAPALVHGNTVVWKPASATPAVAVRLTSILAHAGLPPGVLNLVLAGGAAGSALVRAPEVGAITFTGSEAVGRAIWAEGTARGARVQLEMGGHNPALVAADADLELAAARIVDGAMGSTGQKCTATRRAIVAAPVADELERLLRERVARLRVGDGLDPHVDIGPLVSADAAAEVRGAIARAVADGARANNGLAEPSGDAESGCFVAPTLLGDVSVDMPIAQEEVFGPVLSIIEVDSDADLIPAANATRFGLSASVFTACEAFARTCVDQVNAGVIHVNDASTGSEPHVPFGGLAAASAQGHSEQGQVAREFFTRTKTVYVDHRARLGLGEA